MGKKKKYKRKPFESARPGNEGGDFCVRLYDSMTLSPAFLDLTGIQRDLYRICKRQCGRRWPAEDYPGYPPFDRDEVFFLTYEAATEEGAVCKERTFYKDMKVLARHGFIRVLKQGGAKRGTVYELSDGWKRWEPEKRQTKSAALVSGALL